MTYSAFKKELAYGKIRPAYLFVGKEDYLAETGVNGLIERLLPEEERTLNLTIIYGKDAAILPDTLATPPFFGRMRVAVVRQAQDLADAPLDAVLDFLTHPADDCRLILWASESDKRRQFFQRIPTTLEQVQCSPLKPRELGEWIGEYLAKFGKRLDHEAMEWLLSIHWPGLRELAGELERLALLTGESATIAIKDAEQMGTGGYALERWRLTDAVGNGDIAAALNMLENLQRWRVDSVKIVSDLFYLYQRLWLLAWHQKKGKEAAARSTVSILPFLFEKYCRYARRLGMNRISAGILRLRDADARIKGGAAREDTELCLLITELIHGRDTAASNRGAR